MADFNPFDTGLAEPTSSARSVFNGTSTAGAQKQSEDFDPFKSGDAQPAQAAFDPFAAGQAQLAPEAIKAKVAQEGYTPNEDDLRTLYNHDQSQSMLSKGKDVAQGALDAAKGLAALPGQVWNEQKQNPGLSKNAASYTEGVSQFGRFLTDQVIKPVAKHLDYLKENPVREIAKLASPGAQILAPGLAPAAAMAAGVEASPEEKEAQYQDWKMRYLQNLAEQRQTAAPPSWLAGEEPLPATSAAWSIANPASLATMGAGGGAADAAEAARAASLGEKAGLGARTAAAAGKAAEKTGEALKKVGELPETVAQAAVEKALGPQAAAGVKALGGQAKALSVPLAAIHGGVPETVGAALEGATKLGEGLKAVGPAVERLAEADPLNPFGRLNDLAKDSDAPEWMRVLSSSTLGKGAAAAARGVGAVAKGGVEGAATGAVLGAGTSESPEEEGQNIGGGAVLGAGLNVVRYPALRKAQIMQQSAGNMARLVQQHLAEGVTPETLKKVDNFTMTTAANAQNMFGDKVKVRFLDGDQYAGLKDADGTPTTIAGSAGVWSPEKQTIFLNADSKRGSDVTLLHELMHPLFESEVANRPEVKKQIDQALQDNGQNVDQVKHQYMQSLLAPALAKDGITDPAEVDQRVKLKTADWDVRSKNTTGDPNNWIYSEIMAESGMRALHGKDLVLDVPGMNPSVTLSALNTMKGWLESAGVTFKSKADKPGTILPGFENVIDAPALRKMTYSLLRAQKEHAAGITEGPEQAVKVTPDMWGKHPAAPLHDLGNGQRGNDYVIQTPGGAIASRSPRQTRRILAGRRAEVNAIYPTTGEPLDAGNQTPQVSLRKTISGQTERTGTKLGDNFYASKSFSDSIKAMAHDLESAISNGEARAGWYQQIGQPGATDWKASVARDTGAIEAQFKDFMPVNFLADKQGNVLVRNYSLTALERKAQKWAARHGETSLDQWGGDVGKFRDDVQAYLKNHAEGLSGDTNIGPAKRDAINAFLVGGNRTFEAKNPLRAKLRGEDRQGIVRSYRLDRLETLEPGQTQFAKPDYGKQVMNASPEEIARSTAEDSRNEGKALFSPDKFIDNRVSDVNNRSVKDTDNAVGGKLRLIHYSEAGDKLRAVDPKYMTDYAKQAWGHQEGDLNKSFFFPEGSPLPNVARIEGRHVYGAEVDGGKIYDARKGAGDPLGYFTGDRGEAEKKIKKAGYDGIYVETDDGRKAVIMFKPTPVKPLGFDKTSAGEHALPYPVEQRPDVSPAVKIGGKAIQVPKTLSGDPVPFLKQKGIVSGWTDPKLASMEHGFVDAKGKWVPSEKAFQPAQRSNFYSPDAEVKQGAKEPNEEVRANAADYAKQAGIQYRQHTGNRPLNEDLAKRVADFYQAAQHNPHDPAVMAAYNAFANETKAQWDYIASKGVKMEPWTGKGEPYKNSAEMMQDVRDNKHLWFFPTDAGFGQGKAEGAHPLLAESGVEVNGKPLLVNDLFRAVHDYFGHAKEGYEFGPRGELNAFLSHAGLYSKEARPAMAAETLGQNSWVNYGAHLRDEAGNIPKKGEEGYKPLSERPFAEQKATVLPQHMVEEAMDPRQRVRFEVTGPDGKKYPATLDAIQDFSSIGMGKVPQITLPEGAPGIAARSTTYGPRLEQQGYKFTLPELPKELESAPAMVFSPDSANPRAIRAAAVRDPESQQVFEGPFHAAAIQAALGLPKYQDVTPKILASFEHGFTTNSGEFLNRSEAFDRAQELNQLLEHAKPSKTKGGLGIEHMTPEALNGMRQAQEKPLPAFSPASAAGASEKDAVKAQKEWSEKRTDSPYFKKWFGKSKVVDEEGNPAVVYHGTTHSFDEFGTKRGNVENALGVGHYFTTDERDASSNYLKNGPDLTNRVESRIDQLMNDGMARDKASAQARRELVGKDPRVIAAYLKLENPVVLDKKGGTRFEYNYDEDTNQETGSAVDLYDSIMRIAPEFGADGQKLWNAISENGLDDITAHEVVKRLKESGAGEDVQTATGDYATNEFARRVFQDMGFDGAEIANPAEEYPRMGISQDAKHYIAFKPEQVKSTDNRGTFDEGNPKYRFSPDQEKTEAAQSLEKKGFRFDRDFSDPKRISVNVAKGDSKEYLGWAEADITGKTARIQDVVVNEPYRKQGIAEAMYRELAAEFQRRGVDKITGEAVHEAPLKIRNKLFGGYESDESSGRKEVESTLKPNQQFSPDTAKDNDKDLQFDKKGNPVWGEDEKVSAKTDKPKVSAEDDKAALRLAKRITTATAENGGATFSVTGKKRYTAKDPVFNVSLYPERSQVLDPEQVTPERVAQFIKDNADLLKDKENSVGTWLDKDTGKVWLDVAWTTENKKLAEYAGYKFNQKAIWDNAKGEAIETGGTGEAPADLGPEADRLKLLKEEWDTQHPRMGQQELYGRVMLNERTPEVQNTRDLAAMRPDRKLTPTEEAASALARREIKERTQLLESIDDKVKVRRALQKGLSEVTDFMEKQASGENFDSGKDWYRKDLGKMEETTKLIFPETEDQNKMTMFKLLLAAFSGGAKPKENYQLAAEAFAQYLRNGEIPSTTPFRVSEAGKQRILGRNAEMTADKINGLMEKLGGEGPLVNYLLEKHPETMLGNKDTYGALDLGPKFGRFFLNLMGHENEMTVDLWATRTWHRWMGTPFKRVTDGEGKVRMEMPDVPTDKERDLIFQAFKSISDKASEKLGKQLDPMDIQAVLWYFEKDLYAARGVNVDRGNFSQAAQAYQADPLHTRAAPKVTGVKPSKKVDPNQMSLLAQ